MSRLDLTAKLGHPAIQARLGRKTGPVVVELDPTSMCNLACPNCVTADVLNQGAFDEKRLNRLADELAASEVLGVILIGGGEPLLHRGTVPLVARLRELDIRVGLVTNGTLLAQHAGELAYRCDWIRVSMDAATEQTYAALRPNRSGRGMFTTALNGLRAVSARQDRRAAVGYSIVVQPDNLAELADAARLAERLGCDYVEFKAEMDDRHRIIPLSDEQLAVLRAQLDEARRASGTGFHVHQSSSLTAELSGEQPAGQVKTYRHCPVASLRTTISPSGCYVCSYHRGNPRFAYGSILSESFVDTWRNRWGVVDPSVDCMFHCARHEMNLAILSGRPFEPRPDSDDVFI